MNDFTKEELSILHSCLIKQLINVLYPLENKLISIIENYDDKKNNINETELK